MNVNMSNGWGIVRTVINWVLQQPEGKYVLVKDPNQVGVTRIWRAGLISSRMSGCTLFRRMRSMRIGKRSWLCRRNWTSNRDSDDYR